jgi:hypothetical protein
MHNGKTHNKLFRALAIQYLTIMLFSYLFINLAFFLVLSPLIPNLFWGPLAYSGSETAFVRWTILTLRFYLALIPFFITANVGLWWVMQIFDPDPPRPIHLLLGNLAGILLALPLFLQLPHFMASLGFDPEFAPMNPWLMAIFIFTWTVFIYLLVVSTITASHPLVHVKNLCINPFFWLLVVILLSHAFVAFMGLVLVDLYWIPVASVLLAILIPFLLLCFTFPAHIKIHQKSDQ